MTSHSLKNLFRSLVLLSIAFGLCAQAQNVSTNYRTVIQDFMLSSNNQDFGGYIYFNCSDVETKTEALLQHLGAKDISVKCHGGIDHFQQIFSRPASVSLRYSVLQASDLETAQKGSWSIVNIQKFDDCYLLDQVFLKVKDSFMLRNYTILNTCRRMSQKFHVEVEALLPL